MRALGFRSRPSPGSAAQALEWVDVPVPSPRRGEVRVRIIAAALSRDDVHAAEGTIFGGLPVAPRPTLDKPVVPGLDVSGVVDAVGTGVQDLVVGQRVFGVVYMQRLAGLAPYCCTKASRLQPLPDGWTFAQGAATGFSGSVASMALQKGDDPHGKRCLVVGASGNIGGLIVRMLSAAHAKEVVGICSGANADHVTALGADHVVDYSKGPWSQQLANRPSPFDMVFDCAGGRDIEAQALEVLRGDGHLITICGPLRFLGGTRLSGFQIARAIAYILWRALSSRLAGPRYTFLSGAEPDWAAVERFFIGRGLTPSIDTVYPFERDAVAQAIERLTSTHSRGKLVVAVSPSDDA